jgi:hypothetical protein
MRKLAIGLMAAAGLALAAPAYAEDAGVYIGAGPNGVGVGVDVDHDHDGNWRHHYARDRDEVVIKKHHRDCRTTVIHDGDTTKTIRRCDND